MTTTKIWLSSPHMGGTEQTYVKEAFDTNWVAPLGPNVDGFERSIERYYDDTVHAAALSSGTAAIHLGLKLMNVGPGDVVLCQSMTFSASANPIAYLGATPVFVDSESTTWNISADLLEQAILDCISKGKKPKAIIAVHLYGMPYNHKRINELSAHYDIPILEDAAEAFGSRYHGTPCGSLGQLGILSFNGNKIITTSGGGALLAKDESLKQKAVFLATQARDNAPHYEHSEIGHNYRMSNIIAGIGRGQMEVLDDRVAARRNNHKFYLAHLGGLEALEFLSEPEGYFSNRWLTCILTPSYEAREVLRMALLEENIESRPLWKPMHLQPVFSEAPQFCDGTSELLFERGLCLPSGSNLEEDDLYRIVSIIRKNMPQC